MCHEINLERLMPGPALGGGRGRPGRQICLSL